MAKEDLIGGTLWEQYSKRVTERMINPRFMGEITEDEAQSLGAELVVVDWGAEVCGDAMRLFWAIDPETDVIVRARFKTFGCGTAIASSDVMCELSTGHTVDEALDLTNLDIERALRDSPDKPAIPPQKMHCSVMAYDVIKKAAAAYKGVDMATLEEEDIVCECGRVSLGTIREAIRLNDLKTVEEITQYTKAGAFCKSCIRPGGHERRRHYLENILREVRHEMELEEARSRLDVGDFRSMTLIQKHQAVEQVLDETVRPSLIADGGNLMVVDMKEHGDIIELYISYMGACQGCPSARTGTLGFVEDVLKSELDEGIRVRVV